MALSPDQIASRNPSVAPIPLKVTPPNNRNRGLMVGGVVAALVLVGGVWFFTRGSGSAPGDSVPAAGEKARLVLPPPQTYYAAPDGVAGNDGSIDRPLDLVTALSEKSPAKPGDTVWLRGGHYKGSFVSELRGLEQAPITVRQYPGERATLDGSPTPDSVLKAKGEWTWFWGFEVTNSDPHRASSQAGLWPSDLPRGPGVTALGPHLKFINLVVHDATGGITTEPPSIGTELYGNVIFHNGWQGPDAAQGHGISTQNEEGIRRVAENIVFNQFSDGLYAYGSNLDNIQLEGNIVFNNGALAGHAERNILLGGGKVAQQPVLRQNYTYFGMGTDGGGENNLGYSAGCAQLVAEGNYWIGGNPLNLIKCDQVKLTDNVLLGRIQQDLPTRFPSNSYLTTAPADTRMFTRPNAYEPGRGNIVVYNWGRQSQISIDPSKTGLKVGERFEVHDAQNFYGKLLATGTYEGQSVDIPLAGLTLVPPIGNVPVKPSHTAPDFVVLVVTKAATAPAADTTVAPAAAKRP